MSHSNLELRAEYDQWRLVEKTIFPDFCYQLCPRFEKNQKARYEIRNIFERFLTSHHNHLVNRTGGWDGKSRGLLTSDLPYIKKMIEELFQKRKFFKDGTKMRKIDLKIKVEAILIRVWNHTENDHQTSSVDLDQSIEFGKDFIKFCNGEVYQKIAPFNLNKLKDGGGKTWTEDDLKKMILRYKANLIGSQQWGIPEAVYDHLYSKFGARYEAFASPLNARFLGRDGGYFCSLFQDTDQVFGSLGSFFDMDMLAPLGQNQGEKRVIWSINFPFIESIMEDTFRKVFKAVSRAQELGIELIVFGIMPGWYDCRAFLNLKTFHGLKYLEILKSGQHFYESDKRIVARFESVAYVIDSLSKDSSGPEYCMAFRDMKLDEN
jgi:hypothetical protein